MLDHTETFDLAGKKWFSCIVFDGLITYSMKSYQKQNLKIECLRRRSERNFISLVKASNIKQIEDLKSHDSQILMTS